MTNVGIAKAHGFQRTCVWSRLGDLRPARANEQGYDEHVRAGLRTRSLGLTRGQVTTTA